MGQYIKEQLRKKKAVSEETELSGERSEAGCRKLLCYPDNSRYFLAVRNPDTGISSSRKSEGDLLDVGQGDGILVETRRIIIF